MDPRLDAGDEIPLPGQALDLPDAERSEQQCPENAECKQTAPLAPARRHGAGLTVGSPIMPGIMFAFRWYMIQIEPAMVITSSTAVNT